MVLNLAFPKIILVGMITVNLTFATRLQSAEPDSPSLLAAETLEAALKQAKNPASPEQQVELFRVTARDVMRAVPHNSVVAESFKNLAATASPDVQIASRQWREEFMAARDLLRFEPLLEAPLPEDFPQPTGAGEVRLRQYPTYRLAQTEMKAIEGQAFWTLFNHIKRAEIAMTAPVEITYTDNGEKPNQKATMAFLYRSTQQGTLGPVGKVEVIEVPAQAAVSFGLRGRVTKERLMDAKRRLEIWLEANGSDYKRSGPLRVLEYNSPFVPDDKRFSEIQIPVRTRLSTSGTAR
jgi:SOUL heme-binding protein